MDPSSGRKFHDTIKKIRKQLVINALEQADGSYSEAARILGDDGRYVAIGARRRRDPARVRSGASPLATPVKIEVEGSDHVVRLLPDSHRFALVDEPGVRVCNLDQQGAASGGYRGALAQLAALREERARVVAPLDPAFLALLHHDAGNGARPFDWMEQALEDGDPNLSALGFLAPDLKNVPRFKALMQRMGLSY